MDFPDKTLLAMIKDNWSLTAKGYKADDIVFSQAGFRTDESLTNQQNIWVDLGNMRRLAENEEFFAYFTRVTVVYWGTAKKKEDVETEKDRIWALIEEIKKQCHTSGNWSSDWNHCKVDAVRKVSNTPPIPELYEYELLVHIRLHWEPS